MTQHQDDPPAATPETASDGPPKFDAFTLAGPDPRLDPAAVQPAPAVAPTAAPTPAPSGDYDKYGVPTLDFVRDKIEARYTASLGAEELARQTEEAKSFEQRAEERAKAAEAALAEIRQSLRDYRQS